MTATIGHASPNTAAVLTVSDTAAVDPSLDVSGPKVCQRLEGAGFVIVARGIVPDEEAAITAQVKAWADEQSIALVILTGGTGLSPRDRTPESIRPLLTRETPGLTHLLLAHSIAITPRAALSRPVTGLRNTTLIITLPGSPKACEENLAALHPVLPHAIEIIHGCSTSHPPRTHSCVHKHDAKQLHSSTRSDPLGTSVARRTRESPFELLSIEDARAIIRRHATVLGQHCKPVDTTLVGCVLAETVAAVENVPNFRTSVVDGYAVRAEHCGRDSGQYKVSLASSLATGVSDSMVPLLLENEVMRIATGGIVPMDAAAVVMLEDTQVASTTDDGSQEREVIITVPIKEGENIRQIGSDCRVEELVAQRGQAVSSLGGELGALIAAGIRKVLVYDQPCVGIISTGNELKSHLVTQTLAPGQVRDVNLPSLCAALEASGCCHTVKNFDVVKDNADDVERMFRESFKHVDVLITTGGVSMGEADYIKPVLEHRLGATIHVGRVRMKPGKPTTFATVPWKEGERPKLIFALPGNPVSAMVALQVFVLPALRQMAGFPAEDNRIVSVLTGHDFHLDARPEFRRVHVSVREGKLVALSTDRFQQSSRALSMVNANGLLELPMTTKDRTTIPTGTLLPCILTGPLSQ